MFIYLFYEHLLSVLLRRDSLARFSDSNVGASIQLEEKDMPELQDKYLPPHAKKIKIMLEDSVRTLVHEGPKFPATFPSASIVQERCNLDLPSDTLTARFHTQCVRMGLQEIQKLLRKKPLNKTLIKEAIQESTSAWTIQYKGSTPAEVQKLISLLEDLGMRLDGKTPPSRVEEDIVTLADQHARPLLQKLDGVVTSVLEGIKTLRADIPGLQQEILSMQTLRLHHDEEAEKFDRMAADERKKSKESLSKERSAATKLQVLKISSNTFKIQTDQLLQRSEEATNFLKLYDKPEEKTEADEPPEAALILAYSCNSSTHTS
jgi:hypothetical protein